MAKKIQRELIAEATGTIYYSHSWYDANGVLDALDMELEDGGFDSAPDHSYEYTYKITINVERI